LLAILLATGCATSPPPRPAPTLPSWDQRATQLPAGPWQATGRIAVSADGQGAQGSFTWQQSGDGSRVAVAGPFGLGALQLVLDRDGATLTQGGRELRTREPDQEVERLLGVPLPVTGLSSWLRGLPAPAPREMPAPGTVGFTQEGWVVAYDQFDAAGRPLKFSVTRELPGRGLVRVRAVVERWSEGAP
jgi:outer membrane lipoprotein LolB